MERGWGEAQIKQTMPTLPQAIYRCTQQALYSIANTIYANCKIKLAQFAAYKAKYTVVYVDALIAAVTAAKNIPDEEMRNSAYETLRVDLVPLNDTCKENFQLLKGYINDSYVEAQWKNKYEAAGQTMYNGASGENWEMTVGMNTAMKLFVSAEAAVLAVNLDGDPNMPAAFALKITSDSNAFDLKYDAFKLARQTADETAAKITANNNVYTKLMTVCDDGQRIFANDEATRKMFVFEAVKLIVSPPGTAGLKVTVKKASDNSLVQGATVTIQAAGGVPISLITDAEGVVIFPNLDPSDYNGTVTSPAGNATFVKEVNTGTQARKEVFVS